MRTKSYYKGFLNSYDFVYYRNYITPFTEQGNSKNKNVTISHLNLKFRALILLVGDLYGINRFER